MNKDTKKLTTTAMLCALAYVVMLVGRIPISSMDFLKYDPKDIIITIGGFIYGPLTALIITVIVSLIEMVTVSTTGIIGFVMNVVQSCAFACTAAYFYKRKHTLQGAVKGLVVGCFTATVVMLLWNYFLTPIYMGMPRDAVAEMLLPVFLPFNLIKGAINVALTILVYKHAVTALRAASLIPPSKSDEPAKNSGQMIVLAIVLLAVCILEVLVMKGIITLPF